MFKASQHYMRICKICGMIRDESHFKDGPKNRSLTCIDCYENQECITCPVIRRHSRRFIGRRCVDCYNNYQRKLISMYCHDDDDDVVLECRTCNHVYTKMFFVKSAGCKYGVSRECKGCHNRKKRDSYSFKKNDQNDQNDQKDQQDQQDQSE